ncbi:MAG TPA: hypothetical protein VJM11_08730 [Nevskiaceae bacterium]|nr:hypothetical protein [Nevskiaceae bacterium]
MSDHPLDVLAARLGRPPKSMAALCGLSAEDVEQLACAMEAAAEAERKYLLDARGSPWIVRPLIRAIFRMLRR